MTTYIDPSPANFEAFKNLPRDEPINMLNLLLFRDKAEYPEGNERHGNDWSGRRAYVEYGKTSGPIFAGVGGKIIWRGAFQTMVIGPDDRTWHDGFVAQYPNAGAFLEMVTNTEYQKAVVNRVAALADSRLLRFDPGETGGEFG